MTDEHATVHSIKTHPLFRRGRPCYGRLPVRNAGRNVIRPFEPETTNRRYGLQLEVLKTADVRVHNERYFLFVQIAVANPPPPLWWLKTLVVTVKDPTQGVMRFTITAVVPRGACPLNPSTSARFELMIMNSRIAYLSSDIGTTVEVTTPDGTHRLSGNFRQLLNYGL